MDVFDLSRIGAELPAAGLVAPLQQALADRRAAVVQAPPGTGKTTVVPPVVAGLTTGRVVVTQPRRIAARAAARRLAALTGTRPGELAGHTVRGERQVGPRTRVEFVTTGVLVRRLLADPDLPGVGAIVLDEVHERALDSDLALAMAREVAELREDLLLVAMSATLDADRWAGLLGDAQPAPVVEVDAALHPLTVEWAPLPPGTRRLDHRGVTPDLLDHVARTTRAALATHPDGDALVFLPGAREVDRVVDRVVERLAGVGIDVWPLHGRLGPREQDRALAPGPRRRVVVSTAVAESSLTVPGVRLVVDAGLDRRPAYDSVRGMAGLVTVSESRASAEQRAGRAARLGPGVVVRCFAAEDWARMDAYAPPEIATADLTSFALDVACWGAPRGEGLALPDRSPASALDAAEATLRGLGALGDDGAVSERGRAMARIPADPRLARALLDGAELVGAQRAAQAVALVAGDERAPGADLAVLARQLRRDGGAARQRWRAETDRLVRLLEAPSGAGGGEASEADLGLVVALAHPDRVARRRGGPDDPAYLLASGTGAELPRGSALLGQEWLAVAEVDRSPATPSGALVRAAVAIDEATARQAAAALLVEEEVGRWTGRKVSARRVRRLGAIELSAANIRPSTALARAAVRQALAERGLGLVQRDSEAGGAAGVFAWTDNGRSLARRLALLHRELGEPWPEISEAALLARWQDWLVPEIDALVAGTPADRLDLTSALRRLLPWPQAGRLDELVPERLEVPSGSMVRVDYPEIDDPEGRPVLAVKLQECFGWTGTPRLVDGRVPVLLHLLSPARRPLAITGDLASFWAGAYAQVRAENRGRYPKHPWPEDPLTAPPRRGTTRSGR